VTVAQALANLMAANANESHPWLIAPGERTTVALVEFAPQALGKYLGSVQLRAQTGYIDGNTDRRQTVDVVVPFELLSHVGGVYAYEELHFGVIRPNPKPNPNPNCTSAGGGCCRRWGRVA